MFPKLTAAQLARLERQGTRLQTHAGEILQELGEISRGVFVVEAGSVEALVPPSATQAGSTDELLYLLTPGDFTGEMSTLRGTRVLARIRVREAGAVLLSDAEPQRRHPGGSLPRRRAAEKPEQCPGRPMSRHERPGRR